MNKLSVLLYVRVLNVGGNFEIDQDSSITLALNLHQRLQFQKKKKTGPIGFSL